MTDIVNHLWQSTLFAGLAALAAFALRGNQAKWRYLLWLAASVKFLVPFSLLVSLGSRVEPPVISPAAVERLTVSFSPMPILSLPAAQANTPWWPVALAAVWLLVSMGVLWQWFRRWLVIREALRQATPLALAAPLPVYSSPAAIEPGVFGIFRPVLLLPAGITGTLSSAELDSILAHELAHVRRRDNLTAAVHMLVEALFWFHPLVWWVGARLIEERERACDEEVLRLGQSPQVYAKGILTVCRYYLETSLPCAPGVTGADLKQRIEAIMTKRTPRALTQPRKLILVALGMAALALPVLIGALSAQSTLRPLTFEVASIRPSDPNDRGMRLQNTPDNGLRASGVTLKTLIEFAYDIQDFQISGGPGWLRSDRYDIVAKPGGADAADVGRKTTDAELKTQADRLRERTRALLAERFQLTVRSESAERPVYALVEARGGHKLKATTPDGPRGGVSRNRGLIQSAGAKFSIFARVLSSTLVRPVIDRTGITGEFDFKLEWTEESNGLGKGGELQGEADASGASIFTAIQEQLGLKLESAKGPVDVIVIERAEKPTAN